MDPSEDYIKMSALGRPFQLGMLYDCRKDTIIPGITLWDLDSLQKDVSIKPQPKTEFEIIVSDSIDDKASALNVSPSLKASLLGELVELEGSAKFLPDTKTSNQQARVTLQYKATTRYEQLTMSHLEVQNISHPSVFEHGTATHVVTAILYGAQAFFVFDREVSSSESVQEIEGNLQAVIKKAVSISGNAEINMKCWENSQAENFSCKFHGDFSLESNPVNFQDAMQVYSTLPKMMGDDGAKAVPVTVWLYPLTKMDSRAAKMVREISLVLISDAQKVLEELSEIDMRCNDLGKNPIANTFPEIKKKIQHFQDLCKLHRQTFQKELAGLLPSIRGGGKEEGALADILRSVNQSPFNSQKLQDFLKMKEREMRFVKSCLALLNGIEVLSSQSKLDEIVFDPQNEFVLCFTFTSLDEEEPFLADLQLYLQKGLEKKANSKCQAWFECKQISQRAQKAARSILDFSRVNKPNGKLWFVVSSIPDKDNPGASVYFCQGGEQVSCSFDLPSKPLPLLVSRIRHDSVLLIFQPAEYGRENIISYQVEYRSEGEENWKTVNTESSQETFLLRGLSPNKKYQFQYAARCKPGLSETSNVTQSVKTLPVGQENSKNKDTWNESRRGKETEFCRIDVLRSETPYKHQMSAVCADGAQRIPSEEVEVSISLDEVEKDRLVQRYLPKSRLVVEGQPSIYVLPLKMASDDSTSCLTYHLGEENLRVPNKVIMVMGATGSGKTTLINGMINYILGVQWEDKFRFKLIHEETNRSQAESQTSNVTAYMVNHQKGFKVPFSLTIIDTPGFGDTRGIEHDKLITEKIRTFFSTPGEKHPDHIDAICIVVQASLARLTQPQKYVFDSVLSIFGRDIKDNIQILVTFADGQSPPVLEAIKEGGVPCAKDANGTPVHFKFNNSALFANNKISGGTLNFDEMFWKMGCESMKTFFDSSNALETKSLTLTKEVLTERKHLEAAVEGLEPQIQAGLVKLEELRKTQQALDQHRDEMAANKNFEYEVDKTIPVKEDISGSGKFITNCMNCHYTCHYPCTIAEDDWKYCCAAMDSNTKTCEVCPGRCAWNIHYNQKYKFSYKVVKEKKTYEDLKQKYEHASGEVMTTEKVLEKLSEEYEDVKHILEELIKQCSQSLCRLQEIALKPNPLSTPEYIDLLIMSEKEELKPGYQERIRVLKEMRRKAEIIQKIANHKPLLPEEKAIHDQIEEKKNSSLDKFKEGGKIAMAAVKSWFT